MAGGHFGVFTPLSLLELGGHTNLCLYIAIFQPKFDKKKSSASTLPNSKKNRVRNVPSSSNVTNGMPAPPDDQWVDVVEELEELEKEQKLAAAKEKRRQQRAQMAVSMPKKHN